MSQEFNYRWPSCLDTNDSIKEELNASDKASTTAVELNSMLKAAGITCTLYGDAGDKASFNTFLQKLYKTNPAVVIALGSNFKDTEPFNEKEYNCGNARINLIIVLAHGIGYKVQKMQLTINNAAIQFNCAVFYGWRQDFPLAFREFLIEIFRYPLSNYNQPPLFSSEISSVIVYPNHLPLRPLIFLHCHSGMIRSCSGQKHQSLGMPILDKLNVKFKFKESKEKMVGEIFKLIADEVPKVVCGNKKNDVYCDICTR